MKWFLLFFLALGACSHEHNETIVIRGSDTEVNLVVQLAENYMESRPDVSVAVTGGGSGTGVAALINKKTDIANSSRAFTPAEIALAKERGVEVIPIIFALDALSFVVNEDSNIDSLTTLQLKGIFSGTISNWKEIGGADMEISLYGRQGNSGSFVFIQETILKSEYSQNMKRMNGTSQIVEGIKNDRAGIGYVGIGYIIDKEGNLIDGLKAVNVRAEGQEKAVSPVDPKNVTNGDYPIVRPLYQYIDGKPSGQLKDFILYELSDEGQAIISQNGCFPITAKHRRLNQKYLEDE